MAPHKRTTKLTAATLGAGGMAVALLPGVGLAAPALPPQNPADAATAWPPGSPSPGSRATAIPVIPSVAAANFVVRL